MEYASFSRGANAVEDGSPHPRRGDMLLVPDMGKKWFIQYVDETNKLHGSTWMWYDYIVGLFYPRNTFTVKLNPSTDDGSS